MKVNELLEKQNHNLLTSLFFASGAFLVYVNFYSSSTVLPLFVAEIGGNEFDTGIHTILFYITSILCRFYFGPLTDQKGRKLPLMVGAFVFCTAPLLFLVSQGVWTLALARIYQAIGLAAFFSSGASLVADLAPAEKRGLYMGIYRLLYTLALLSAPSGSLYIIKNWNFSSLFILSFLVGLVAIVFVSLIKPPLTELPYAAPNYVECLSQIIKIKPIPTIFLGIALITACYGALVTFTVLYISRLAIVTNPGLYFTYFCLAGTIANISAGHFSDRLGRSIVLWPSAMLLGIGMILLSFLPFASIFFILSGILTGIGFSAGIAALFAWLVDVIDEKIRGTVLAIQESVFDLGFGVGSLLFGFISGWIGMGASFVVLGLIVLVTSLILFMGSLLSLKTGITNKHCI